MINKQPAVVLDLLMLVMVYVAAMSVGIVIFIVLLHVPPFSNIGILFYRGVAALAVTGPLLLGLLALLASRLPKMSRVHWKDTLGASISAISIIFAGFILGPVTVDRSITVFLLSQIEASKTGLTTKQVQVAFVDTYVELWDQISRRLKEQEASGNIEKTPDGWRLTAQGSSFMTTARLMSEIFGGDPRFVGRSK